MVKKKIVDYLNLNKSFGLEYCEPISFDTHQLSSGNSLPNNIQNLNSYIEHCCLCELSKITKKKTIGFGSSNSEIYIVGVLSDFQNENISILLKELIENTLELNTQDVYLTNLIKCSTQPKSNINKNNIDLCKEYFIKQVDIIRPKYIIALGNVSSYLLKNENNISYIYGNSYDYNGLNLIPMLDLEFVYKNPSYKDELYKDFKKLKMLMGQK
jgi:DNA polymerase